MYCLHATQTPKLMYKQNSILLLTTVVIFLTFSIQSPKTFGQFAEEKDLLLTEYPIYFDLHTITLIEAQITDVSSLKIK